MLTLEVYVAENQADEVRRILAEQPGASHVTQLGVATGGLLLLTAHVAVGVVDPLLPRLEAAGVAGDDLALVHRDSNRPLGSPAPGDIPSWSGGGLAVAELSMSSRHYARVVPQYLAFMACAGIIAGLGILTHNTIAIVGAMAISPDLFPLCAVCVGLVDARPRMSCRAFATLAVGLTVTGLTAYGTTALLRWQNYGPATGSLGDGGLGVIPTVNVATVGIALAAGVAGILSFESRSSSAVGVAISITTVPAAAFVGASVAVHDGEGAGGAIAVLGVNIVVLIMAGTLTLIAQRRWGSRS